MKRHNQFQIILTIFMLTFYISGFSQTENYSWKLKPELPKIFIENKGQFPVTNHGIVKSSDVLYAIDNGQVMIYFTKKGLTYTFNKKILNKEKESIFEKVKDFAEKEEKERHVETETDIVRYIWENANPDVEIVPDEIADGYYNYGVMVGNTQKSINNIKAYRKLTYKNLYPGIDVEFIFHPVEGIKYSVILNPGADISVIRMKYIQARKMTIKKDRNVHISTKFGDIIDHAPRTFYKDEYTTEIKSRFIKKGKTISFMVDPYDHTKTLVIDPWTINPPLPACNRVWDIDKDTLGNAYIYGGDMPMTLQKYNSAGVFQWTYTTPWDSSGYWIGTMNTNRAGFAFITSGSNGEISKINPSGGLVWHNNPNGILGPLFEYWDMSFNCDETQLVVGGMRTPSAMNVANYRGAAMNIDLTNGSVLNYTVVGHVSGLNIKEIRTICQSPNGNYYYLTLDSIGAVDPSLNILWQTNSTYNFSYGNPSYQINGNMGIRAIRATQNFIYSMSGATIHKRSIVNGAVVGSAAIPGGIYNVVPILGGYTIGNSGMELDTCGNVYVGSGNGIYKYDANLNLLTSRTTPSAVYDIAVSKNGEVFACGNGYALAVDMSACPPVRTICRICPTLDINTSNIVDVDCSGNLGSFEASTSGGASPYDYTLLNSTGSPVATFNDVAGSQSFTGLPADTYTLNVLDNAGCPGFSTVIISQPNNFTIELTATDETCSNSCDGQLACTVSGGVAPVTYLWSNGQTTQIATGLCAGNYTITVSDGSGCHQTSSASVSSGIIVTLNLTPQNATCPGDCNGQIDATVSGGSEPYAYRWNSGQTSATITNLCPGTFRVTVTDANNCRQTSQAVIATRTNVSADFSASPMSGATPLTVNFNYTGTGANTYNWSFGDGSTSTQQNPSNTYNNTGSYDVILIVNSGSPDFCSDTSTITIVTQLPSFLTVPNAFSPNNDGYNDEFIATSQSIVTFKGQIFNRWGKKIFEWENVAKGWNGKTPTGNSAEGVYYYIITAKGVDGVNYNLSGSITLLR